MVVINSCVETKTRLNSSRPVYRLVETFNLKKFLSPEVVIHELREAYVARPVVKE